MIHFLTQSTQHLRPLFLNRHAGVGTFRVTTLSDGEWNVRLGEDVRRKPVTLVGSVLADPGTLFDLIASFRVLRDNRSLNPSLVIPYLGYARQDRTDKAGEAAVGIMIAELLRNLNVAGLTIMDAHSRTILNALGPNAVEISAVPLLAQALLEDEPVDVVVAADQGARERAEAFAALLRAEVAVIEKVRPKPNAVQAKSLTGDVTGKNVVIVDDMIDTGGTMIEAVRLVSKRGASSIRAAATHGLFSGDAREKISALPIRHLYVTNTLPQSRQTNVTVLDVTPILLSV